MNTKPILIALILNFLLISAVSSEVKSVESHTRILKKADARAFLMKNLDLISNMDDRIFGVLIDSNLILPAERIKKMLKFNPEYKKTRKMWKQYFPGYYFIKKGDIQRIKIKQAYGPYDTKVRILTGGTSKKPDWKKSNGSYMLLYVKIPRMRIMTCKVFLISGKLYWEPFGW